MKVLPREPDLREVPSFKGGATTSAVDDDTCSRNSCVIIGDDVYWMCIVSTAISASNIMFSVTSRKITC